MGMLHSFRQTPLRKTNLASVIRNEEALINEINFKNPMPSQLNRIESNQMQWSLSISTIQAISIWLKFKNSKLIILILIIIIITDYQFENVQTSKCDANQI